MKKIFSLLTLLFLAGGCQGLNDLGKHTNEFFQRIARDNRKRVAKDETEKKVKAEKKDIVVAKEAGKADKKIK